MPKAHDVVHTKRRAAKGLVIGLAFGTLAAPWAAAAASDSSSQEGGAYVATRGGYSHLSNATVNLDGFNDAEFEMGFVVSGAVGYRFEASYPGLRAELEGFFSKYGNDKLAFEHDKLNFTGDTTVAGSMLNLFYDFKSIYDFGGGQLRPFLGAGIGMGVLAIEGRTQDAPKSAGELELKDQTDSVFAYQLRLGLGYELARAMTASVGYRFFDTEDPVFDRFNGLESHTAEVGLRYAF